MSHHFPPPPLPVIVFDFDGTIADTLDAIVTIANRLAPEFGFTPVSQREVESYRNLNAREVIRRSRIPLVKIPFLIRRVQAELNREIQHLKPIIGVMSVLTTLRQRGHRLGIVTSNSSVNVTTFLKKQGLESMFDFIHSGATLFGKSRIMKQLLAREGLTPGEIIYVGDETRDIDAAQAVKITMISVAWGFNTAETLARHHPDFLIHHPYELLELLDHNRPRFP